MGCVHYIPYGSEHAITFCGKGQRRGDISLCAVEGCVREAVVLCDFPMGKGKTCDAPLCLEHAAEAEPGLHFCRGHAFHYGVPVGTILHPTFPGEIDELTCCRDVECMCRMHCARFARSDQAVKLFNFARYRPKRLVAVPGFKGWRMTLPCPWFESATDERLALWLAELAKQLKRPKSKTAPA